MQSAKLWLLVLVLCALSPMESMAQYTHMPAGSTVLVECTMENISACPGVIDVYGNVNGNNVSDSRDPISPSSGKYFALPDIWPCNAGISIPLPCAEGGGTLYWVNTAAPMREIYVLVIAGLNPEYGCSLVGASKDWFIMSYNAPFGHPPMNGYFGSSGCGTTKTTFFGHNTGGLNNAHACGGIDGGICNPNQSSGTYQAGTVNKHQFCLKASTTTTSRDGIVAWSLNDVWAGIYTNMNYGAGNLNEWQWNKTWDKYGNGQGFTAHTQQNVFHLRIAAVPDGGCAAIIGGSTSPPPPPSPTPPPPPPGLPGTVTDLSAVALSPTSVQLSFAAVDDGTGAPAKYDIRQAASPINWGAAPSVTNGTCATPFAPNVIGPVVCTIGGLSPSTAYQFQLVPYRGTLNAGATFSSSLSNVASASTPFVEGPAVTSFSPLSGPVGTSVVLTGTAFDPTIVNNTVKINGQAVTVTSASATSLTVTIPGGSTTGRFSVQTSTGTGFSDQSFVITVIDQVIPPNSCGCS